MSYIISVYGEKAFKKMLLPAINNADYKIVLYKDIFGIENDLILEMEIVNGQWSFKKSSTYVLSRNGEEFFGHAIKNNDIIQLAAESQKNLTILVYEIDTPFEVYRKYSLNNLRKVTIGKDQHNHIRYDYFGLVSKKHAVLEITENGCRIHDLSSNGVFVNSIRVKQTQELKFGDSIHILGLQMIYLGNLIAIEQASAPVAIDSFVLKELDGEKLGYFSSKYSDRPFEKTVFHRTPRNIEKIDDEGIEIENPPQPVQMRQQSLLLSIGPAFTMAIPMLLGSMLSIYSYRSLGTGSAFMYTGLVTAVSSAVLGAVWATVNLKNARKTAAAEEQLRKTAYVEYLEKSMASVKEKYDKNTMILNTRYPSAGTCAGYGRNTVVLWNRNQHHDDFLYHRIGLGRIPFQAPIEIAKERFQVRRDELAMKPKDIKVEIGRAHV